MTPASRAWRRVDSGLTGEAVWASTIRPAAVNRTCTVLHANAAGTLVLLFAVLCLAVHHSITSYDDAIAKPALRSVLRQLQRDHMSPPDTHCLDARLQTMFEADSTTTEYVDKVKWCPSTTEPTQVWVRFPDNPVDYFPLSSAVGTAVAAGALAPYSSFDADTNTATLWTGKLYCRQPGSDGNSCK